ncbi:MAG: hypothetical protein ACREEV_10420 [Dongiaceae bacterium]
MDDLLKVFLGETAECLAACWIAVDELRENPGDSAALVELLRQVRTVQETSRFLGMTSLNAAASLTLESLESATSRRPASIDRIVPIAVDGLQRVEEIIRAIADGEAGTVRHSIRTEPTPRSGSGGAGQMDEGRPRSQGRAKKSSAAEPGSSPAARQPRTSDDLLADLVAAASGGAASVPTPGADGTVRVNADTLSYLLSTVRELADAQAEMMRRLNANETKVEAPSTAMPPAARSISTDVPSAPPSDPVPPPSRLLGKAAAGKVRVLLFRDAGGALKAVHLDRVARLEEADLKAVDRNRGLWVIRSGDDLLPLVPFDPAYRLPAVGRAPVIVFTIDRDTFGLLVESIPEVADVVPADQGRDVVLLDGRAIEVVDPARYLERTIRVRFQRRRAERKRGPAADEYKVALPEDDDLFVRKPTR